MKQQTLLHIPTPCHEDWNQMTPQQQGRFCSSCQKTVIDFSVLSDNQVLNIMSKATGNVCGRFQNDQLNRPLQPQHQPAKRNFKWLMATLASLWLSNKSMAQGLVGKITVSPQPAVKTDTVKTKVLYKKVTLKGKVTDELGQPIAHANLFCREYNARTTADSNGMFQLVIRNVKSKQLPMLVTSTGYQDKPLNLYLDGKEQQLHILMSFLTDTLEDVVVIGYLAHQRSQFISGGISTVLIPEKKSIVDTAIKFCQKVTGTQPFKLTPNPCQRGQNINVTIKEAGTYQLLLMDNNGQVYQVKEIVITTKNQMVQLTAPTSIAAGIYYVRLINATTKKQYVEKVVLQ